MLGIEVKGTAWWTRTVELAAMAVKHFGDVEIGALEAPGYRRVRSLSLARRRRTRARRRASTRHKVLTWFKRFGAWCVTKGHLAANPCDGFEIPAESVIRRDRILDAAEEEKFWAELEELPLKAKVRVGLVLWTGARSGEVETIRVSDVAPQFGTVRRRLWKKSRGDSPKEAVVKVPSNLMALVTEWIAKAKLEQDELILPVRCQAGGKFLRRWKTSMRGMRRTVLTRLHDAGVPLRVIQEAAGHAMLDTTQRYLGVGETAVNDALSSLDWGSEGAIKSAITTPHHVTTDRDLTRQDRETSCTRAPNLSEEKGS